MVLWNTRYLDAAQAQARASGAVVKPEDVERLSPLLLDHVNVLGRYEFALKASVRQGQQRPLREPDDWMTRRRNDPCPVFCSIATHGPHKSRDGSALTAKAVQTGNVCCMLSS